MSARPIVIGSRGSDLALFQARYIQSRLTELGVDKVEIKVIATSGDRIDDLSFDKMEGKGFFTKELEEALLARQIDLAVHSLKDLMTTQPRGLKLGAIGYRADRREMLLIRREAANGRGLLPVRPGGKIGTSSARRACQIACLNPELKIDSLRGNVPTRIRKLREGQYDAILIAAAGVTRLELDVSDLEVVLLEPEVFLPAPAQGILGMQIRDDDSDTEEVVSGLDDPRARTEAALERGLLARFDAGCSLPLGVYSEVQGDRLRLRAVLGVAQDSRWIGLCKADAQGTSVNSTIDHIYDKLTRGVPHCA
ncbi:MAG: hydroxymethylbilane synthase [candidate division Zixibacteria bacterium]|nr:hydroxymethylbilane synthase [candidate division Zixibacteria bacterium]